MSETNLPPRSGEDPAIETPSPDEQRDFPQPMAR
jgi:hypothetical protein